MTSDKDDLEEALQENLRLRRQLGAEASKGKTIRAGGRSAVKNKQLLYIAGALFAVFVATLIFHLVTSG